MTTEAHSRANKKYYKNNKDKIRRKLKAYYTENRDAWLLVKKKSNFKQRYGITFSDFEKMVTNQDYKCKICGSANVELVVDHNHTNGRIRGLLCRICNMLLGCAKDDPEVLEKASAYLRSSDDFTG